jgi:hypothetical protein
MATTRKDPYFRPAKEGGPVGRGATSPLGGRSNPDTSFASDGTGRIVRKTIAEARKGQQPFPRRGSNTPLVS